MPMRLRDLLEMLHNPRIPDGGEKDWDTLLDYEVQIHTGEHEHSEINIENVYTDDSDNTINIDVGLPRQ